MTIFWILAAGFSLLALAFILFPLLEKPETAPAGDDQNRLNLAIFRQQLRELDEDLAAGNLEPHQYRAARRDLERELLSDIQDGEAAEARPEARRAWVLALLLSLALPAFAVGTYLVLGEPDLIPRLEGMDLAATAQPPHGNTQGGNALPPLDELVARLAEKMAHDPDNPEGWLMLGRSYLALNQPQKARDALARAYALVPDNPTVLLSYAQALATAAGGDLQGRPAELIAEALRLDPKNQTGRWLGGLAAYQAGRFADAVARWESLLADLKAGTKEAGELQGFIQEARRRGGLPAPEPATAPKTTQQETPPPNQEVQLRVRVRLAESLWKQADVDQALFIYAKAVSGPPMPLAVRRLRVGDLPVTVTLDDSLAMMPALRLSAFPEVLVGARISRSGQATPQSGDLEGETGPVDPRGSEPVEVVIDRVRP